MSHQHYKLSLMSLVAITLISVDSIRNLPAFALFGSYLPVIFTLATLFFLLPSAWTVSCFTAHFKDAPGIYYWIKKMFGPRAGFYAVWFQWVNNLIWYPVIISFTVSTACFFFAPHLAVDPHYIGFATMITFWLLTLINLFDLRISAGISNICIIFGLLIPMVLIISMGIFWLAKGHISAIALHGGALWPNLKNLDIWVSLTTIMLSFCGIEVATVHAKNVANPNKNFPKAMIISSLFIFVTLMLGGLSIAVILPHSKINLLAGIVQTMNVFLNEYHMHWLLAWIALMTVFGTLGGVNNWIIAPIKGIWYAAKAGEISPWFAKSNRYHAPHRLLLVQGLVVTLVTTIYLYIPNVNAAYWLLSGGALELYMVMYIMMFLGLIKLLMQDKTITEIPGSRGFAIFMASLGLIGSLVSIAVSMIPPDFMPMSTIQYAALMLGLMATFTIVPCFLHQTKKITK